MQCEKVNDNLCQEIAKMRVYITPLFLNDTSPRTIFLHQLTMATTTLPTESPSRSAEPYSPPQHLLVYWTAEELISQFEGLSVAYPAYGLSR